MVFQRSSLSIFIYLPLKSKMNKMKKIIAVLAVTLLLASCNQTKIAYVDVEEILKEYKGMKDAQKEMDTKEGEYKKTLDQLAINYQTGLKDYQEKGRRMSAKKRQEIENGLMQQQQILSQRQQQAQQELQKFGQEKMEEINENIEDFIADYAKKNGYSYIFGTSEQTKSVLYGDSKTDLTDEILEALNDDYKHGNKESSKAEKDTVN